MGTATSGEDGKVTFSGLYRNSEYRLVETKAPEGRVLPTGQWRITTDENNAIGEIVDVYVNGDVPPAFSGEGGGLSLPNMMALNLPVLGGQTMLTYIVMGELFILLAVLIVGRKLYVKSRGKA